MKRIHTTFALAACLALLLAPLAARAAPTRSAAPRAGADDHRIGYGYARRLARQVAKEIYGASTRVELVRRPSRGAPGRR